MTTALVTGAGGFLGRHLCKVLLGRGIQVHGLGRSGAMPEGVVAHAGDIVDRGATEALVSEVSPDWIFHLAAAKSRDRDPAILGAMYASNVVGTWNLLEAARASSVGAFVAVGSFEEYGDNAPPFREDMAPRPASPYGITKAAATALVAGVGRSALPAVVLRPSLPYGPGQPGDSFVGSLIESLVSGKRFQMTAGEQTRDFVFVEDVARAFVAAAEGIGRCRGEILNVCSGEGISLKDAAAIVAGIAGATGSIEFGGVSYRPGEQMGYRGDASKAEAVLGWKATTPFEEGIRITLAAAHGKSFV